MQRSPYVAPEVRDYGNVVAITAEDGLGCVDVPEGTPAVPGDNIIGDCS